MSSNYGKKFESVVRQSLEKIDGISIDRLHDQTTRFKGSQNICDFIVYKKPYEYYIECKSVHGNTLSIHSKPKPDKHGILHGFYGNVTDTQWEGLLQKSKIEGVKAGVLCWWVDKDVTRFIPIQVLESHRKHYNSLRWDMWYKTILIKGKKKRVFFDYDFESFFKEV